MPMIHGLCAEAKLIPFFFFFFLSSVIDSIGSLVDYNLFVENFECVNIYRATAWVESSVRNKRLENPIWNQHKY